MQCQSKPEHISSTLLPMKLRCCIFKTLICFCYVPEGDSAPIYHIIVLMLFLPFLNNPVKICATKCGQILTFVGNDRAS